MNTRTRLVVERDVEGSFRGWCVTRVTERWDDLERGWEETDSTGLVLVARKAEATEIVRRARAAQALCAGLRSLTPCLDASTNCTPRAVPVEPRLAFGLPA